MLQIALEKIINFAFTYLQLFWSFNKIGQAGEKKKVNLLILPKFEIVTKTY